VILTSARSGYGNHGDYLFGWKEGALQRGMDALLDDSGCLNEVCPALKTQTPKEAAKCTKKTQVRGDTVGLGGECECTRYFPGPKR
jgi:hypothetical protein